MDPAQKLLVAINLRKLIWHLRTSNPIVDEAIQKNIFEPFPLIEYQKLVLEMAPSLDKYVSKQGPLKGEDFKKLLTQFSDSRENYYDRLSRAIEKGDVNLLKPDSGKEAEKPEANVDTIVAAPPPADKPVQPTTSKPELSQSQQTVKKPAAPEAKLPTVPREHTQEQQQERVKTELRRAEQASEIEGETPAEAVTTRAAAPSQRRAPAKEASGGFFIRRPGRSVRSVPGFSFRRASTPIAGGLGRVFRSGPVKDVSSLASRVFKIGSTRAGTGLKDLVGRTGRQAADMATQPGGGAGNRGKGGGGNLAGFNIPGLDRILNRGGGRSGGFRRIARGGGRRLLIILLLLLAGGVLLGLFNIFGEPTVECGKGGEVDLQKSGPTEAENGKQIDYQILVNFKGSCVADVTVTDQVPANTKFLKADSSYKILGGFDTMNVGSAGKLIGNAVTWELKAMTTGQTATLTLSVEPTKEDAWVVNEASYNARFQGGTQGGTTGGRGGSSPPEGAQEQDKQLQAVVGGQGRNVAIIGDENAFMSQVIANGAKLGLNATKESYIRMIYQAAQKWNINPLIILGTWGTETGFRPDLADKAFSCPVRVSSSFEAQVDCSARIYNKWMSKFEAENKNGVLPIEAVGNRKGAVCEYNDPLIYAMDWYGPICHASDNNVNYRPNMLKYYKAILGN